MTLETVQIRSEDGVCPTHQTRAGPPFGNPLVNAMQLTSSTYIALHRDKTFLN
jgi:hypothetical protein